MEKTKHRIKRQNTETFIYDYRDQFGAYAYLVLFEITRLKTLSLDRKRKNNFTVDDIPEGFQVKAPIDRLGFIEGQYREHYSLLGLQLLGDITILDDISYIDGCEGHINEYRALNSLEIKDNDIVSFTIPNGMARDILNLSVMITQKAYDLAMVDTSGRWLRKRASEIIEELTPEMLDIKT